MEKCYKCNKKVEKVNVQIVNGKKYKLCDACTDEMLKQIMPEKEKLVNKLYDEMNSLIMKFVSEKALDYLQPERLKDNKGEGD